MSEPQGFFQGGPLRRFAWRWSQHWLERHQHPFNRRIHFLGIPMTFIGVLLVVFLPWDDWYWGVGAFVLGYLLQWIGHLVEGNDMGEVVAIKRVFGLPFVAIAPQYQKPPGPEDTAPQSSA
jgi:hypothetical protein